MTHTRGTAARPSPTRRAGAPRTLGYRLTSLVLLGLTSGGAAACDMPPSARAAPAALTASHPGPNVMPADQSDAPVYLGRFAMAVPTGTRPILEGARVDEVEVRPATWTPTTTAAQVWAAHVQALEADPTLRPAGASNVVLMQRSIGHGARLLLRHASSDVAVARAAEALVDRGPASLWLEAAYAPGYEAQVQGALTDLAAAYATEARTDARDEATPAYHLALGALRVPFGYEEGLTARLSTRAPAPLRDVSVAMAIGPDPDWGPGPIAEWRAKAASPLGRTLGVRVTLVRAGRRTVAGMDGEEVVARLTGEGEAPSVAFLWEYRGEEGAPTRPHLTLSGTATAADEAAATAAWDGLITSVRPLRAGAAAGAAAGAGAAGGAADRRGGA